MGMLAQGTPGEARTSLQPLLFANGARPLPALRADGRLATAARLAASGADHYFVDSFTFSFWYLMAQSRHNLCPSKSTMAALPHLHFGSSLSSIVGPPLGPPQCAGVGDEAHLVVAALGDRSSKGIDRLPGIGRKGQGPCPGDQLPPVGDELGRNGHLDRLGRQVAHHRVEGRFGGLTIDIDQAVASNPQINS